MNYPVLVLGASDELIIPDFECKEVFTCNSSAIKGKIYSSTKQKCQAYLVLTGVNNACYAIQVALIREQISQKLILKIIIKIND